MGDYILPPHTVQAIPAPSRAVFVLTLVLPAQLLDNAAVIPISARQTEAASRKAPP